MSPTSEPAAGVPMASLAELRSRHSTLLQRRTSGSELTEADMLEFLRAASQTGANIPEEDMDARESAQGILDYWTATLLSQNPAAANEAHGFFTLAPFHEARGKALTATSADLLDDARVVAEKANAFSARATPAERKVLSALLLRLVNLKKEVLEVFTQRVAETEVQSPELKEMKEHLLEEGILVRRGESGAPATLSLRHDLLLTEWTHLAGLIKKRRAFRELASGWRRGGEAKSALLSAGDELELAKNFRDLDPVENDFMEASRSRGENVWRVMLGGVLVVLAVVITLSVVLYGQYKKRGEINAELTSANLEKDRVSTALEVKVKELTELSEVLGKQRLELQTQAAILKKNGKELDTNNKLLKASNEAADKLIKQLAEKTAKAEESAGLFQNQVAALTKQMKELEESTAQKEVLLKKLGELAKTIGRGQPIPVGSRNILNDYLPKTEDDSKKPTEDLTQSALAQSLGSYEPGEILRPGTGITVGAGPAEARDGADASEIRGSLGVIVQDEAGENYFIAPGYMLSVKEAGSVSAGWQKPLPIGKVSDLVKVDSSDLTSLGLVKLDPGQAVSNSLDGVGEISGIETHLTVGMEVILVGSGSGLSRGKIREVPADGPIVTDRISKAGDAGAPVINAETHKLIGLLIAGGNDESRVVPVNRLLADKKLKLYQSTSAPTAADSDFAGVLAEIFVSADDPTYVARGGKYGEALQKAGIVMPVPEAQPRNKVPAVVSEVRYFYDDAENKTLAEKVMALLIQVGIPTDKVRVSLTPDVTAPRRFIQVSLSRAVFVTVGR